MKEKRIIKMRGEEFERLTIPENVAKLKSNYEGLLKHGLRKERDIPVEKEIKLSAYEDLGYTPEELKILIDSFQGDPIKCAKTILEELFKTPKQCNDLISLVAWLKEYAAMKEMYHSKKWEESNENK